MDATNISMPTLGRTDAIANLEPIAEHLAPTNKPEPSVDPTHKATKSTAAESEIHNIDFDHDISNSSSAQLANIESIETKVSLHIEHLVSGLGDPDLTIASAAMQALVEVGTDALPALINAIDNYENNARVYAIRALATIGDPRSLESLIQSTQPDELMLSVRRAAIVGLAKINWQDGSDDLELISRHQTRILDVLAGLLTDQNWSIRYAVVVALAQLSQNKPHTRISTLLESVCVQEAEPVVKTRASLAFAQAFDQPPAQPELMAIAI